MNDSREPNQLDGTTAIVTGASRGFGRSVAAALTAAGAHVVGVARSAARWPSWATNWVTASPP